MSRLAHRLAVVGVVSGTVLAMSSAAVAQAEKPPQKGADCVVQHVDERGKVLRTETAPEGREYGQLRCVAGKWTFAWAPFGADDMITADEIQINPAGTASVRRFTGPALGNDLTVGEMTGIAQAVSGSRGADRPRDRGGRRRQGADPGAGRGAAGRQGHHRGTGAGHHREAECRHVDEGRHRRGRRHPETTVVYFSIWGAIKAAIAWIVDTLGDIGEWIDDHCDLGSPNDFGDIVTCRW